MKSFVVLAVVLFFTRFAYAAQMVYEFGFDEGELIYSKDGYIPLLKYDTTVDIPIPDNTAITYLKVTVNSLSPPKVSYEANRVHFKYTWVQVSASTYNIQVKGVAQNT